ncbi:MAG: SufE family protein [Planctomycetia bacterium]|nr:SufE family protein [Planctomycetia bacterium]
MTATVADKLDQIAAEFAELEPRERLELLLEFAEKLAPLPSEYQPQRDAGLNRVAECQTPVFLWVVIEHDQVRIFADVAPEAPTVKGFVSVLVDIFSAARPDEVIAMQANLVQRFGLAEALGMVRMRGMQAIAHSIRQHVIAAMAA